MRKISTLLLFTLCFCLTLRAENLWMFLDVCQFSDIQSKPYVETYISIDGGTVSFTPNGKGKYQGKVNLLFFLYRLEGKDSTLIQGDNLNLLSLEADDTTQNARRAKSFRHLLRHSVEPGKYCVIVETKDLNLKGAKSVVALNEFEVHARNGDAVSLSDVEFVSAFGKSDKETPFVKNGFELIPYNTNGFFIDKDELQFYLEIYNSNKSFSNDYFLRSQIKQGTKIFFEHTKTFKKAARQIDILTHTYNIAKLPSDDYELEICILDAKNQIVKKVSRRFDVFHSTNTQPLVLAKDNTGIFSKYSDEELKTQIKTLLHISNQFEMQMAKALETKQQREDYLYSFFKKRVDADGKGDVAMLWDLHLKKIEYANLKFKASFTDGWKTDRGRVLMRYGKPSNVDQYPAESGLLPYEIWRYDRLETQSNIMFVFCDRDQATNTYELLHSNKYGEAKNPRWRDFIQGDARERNKTSIDYEDPNRQNGFDNRIDPNSGIGDH